MSNSVGTSHTNRAATLAGVLALAAVGALLAAPRPVNGATTFTVNRTGDAADLNLANSKCDTSSASGNQCTLRAAIQEANDTPGADTINFKITSTSKVIKPASALPDITDPVTINGYSQSGTSANTQATGNNAVLKIVLDGVNAGTGVDGLRILGDDALVRGLVIQRFDRHGIVVVGNDNVIEGCFVGTNAAGALARGNGENGIVVVGSSNFLGGAAPAARNLISGNVESGILFQGSSAVGNDVQNSYIGTNKGGTAAVPNGRNGIDFLGLSPYKTIIGGDTPAVRNVISGNSGDGVSVGGDTTTVAGNYIGTNAAGTGGLGNGNFGVSVSGDRVLIGGSSPSSGNVISANGIDGIRLSGLSGAYVRRNLIGTKADGTGDLGNTFAGISVSSNDNTIDSSNLISGNGTGISIGSVSEGNTVEGNVVRSNDSSGILVRGPRNTIAPGNVIFGNGGHGVRLDGASNLKGVRIHSNQIFGNGQLGIDLSGGSENAAGVTANDLDDPDGSENDLQNFPVLSSATRSNQTSITTVTGSLNSNPSTEFRIHIYLAAADASGYGEGQVLLGSQLVTTNGGGDVGFNFQLTGLAAGHVLTATAMSTGLGNTSEFSLNVTVVPGA
jgi:hypothetical protein